MGQYFYPTFYKKHGTKLYGTQFLAHDYGNGLKLTEHSYVGNNFVETVLTQLYNNPQNVYWCGDYFNRNDFQDETTFNRMKNTWRKYHVKFDAQTGKHTSTYPKLKEVNDFSMNKFIVNHTKKCFINMREYVEQAPMNEWVDAPLHPLCILTAVGNERGGGDYYGPYKELAGSWAGDLIEIQDPKPNGYEDVTADYACFLDE